MTFRDYTFGHKELGEGFSSIVYKAKKFKSKQQFALKIIKEDFLKSDLHKKLLFNQIQIYQALKNHKNFVHLIQHGKYQNTYFFVMEFCEKGSLASFLQRVKKLQQTQAIYIIKEVIQAYKVLFSMKILHRDLKPANILITVNNEIKLCDFGLSIKAAQADQYQMLRIGTPCYMAPEVVRQNIYTYKADIWSIGVIYYLMLFGELPFKSHNYENFLKQVNETQIQDLISQQISDFSKTFLQRTLCKDHQQRMSAEELFGFEFESKHGKNSLNSSMSQKLMRQSRQHNKNLNKSISFQNLDNTLKSSNTLGLKSSKLTQKVSRKTQNTESSQTKQNVRLSKDQIQERNHSGQGHEHEQKLMLIQQKQNKELQRKLSKQEQKALIKEMQKVTKIVMNQIDFLRFVSKMTYWLQRYFKHQFELLKQLMKQYIYFRSNQLRHLSFVQREKVHLYKKYPLYKAWMQLIQDYQKNITVSEKTKFHCENLETLLSKCILQIYLDFDKSIKTKLNAGKLITLDYMICLKDLLEMMKKGEYYFLKHSMINVIMDGVQKFDLDPEQIDFVFMGISKKLTNYDYS